MHSITKSLIVALVAGTALAGCSRTTEPWDSTGYFANARVRSVVQERALQNRLMHTQAQRDFGGHQTAYEASQ